MSRLNLGKVYNMEINVRAASWGRVAETSFDAYIGQFYNLHKNSWEPHIQRFNANIEQLRGSSPRKRKSKGEGTKLGAVEDHVYKHITGKKPSEEELGQSQYRTSMAKRFGLTLHRLPPATKGMVDRWQDLYYYVLFKTALQYSKTKTIPDPSSRNSLTVTMRMAASAWYEKSMHNAMSWSVILSDVWSRQHSMIDGATAILQICQACIGSDDIPCTSPEITQQLRYPNERGTPMFAYKVLISRSNRKRALFIRKLNAEDTTDDEDIDLDEETFGDLAFKTWQRLELLRDHTLRRQQEENIQLTFKARELIGFEFNDLVDAETRFPPKAIQLLAGTSHWLQLAAKWGTVNLFARRFGDLIRTKGSRSVQHQHPVLPLHSDFLVTTMAVMKKMMRDRISHTTLSVELADGLFWSNPSAHFANCSCGANRSTGCTKTVIELDSKAPDRKRGETLECHPIFEDFPSGAVVFGHSSGKTVRPQHQSLSSSVRPQIQASRSNVDALSSSQSSSLGDPLGPSSSNQDGSLQSSVSSGEAGSSSQITAISSVSSSPTAESPSKFPIRPKGKNKVKWAILRSVAATSPFSSARTDLGSSSQAAPAARAFRETLNVS